MVRLATGAPERGDKLCHLVALTLGWLRWRGAVLAVGAGANEERAAKLSEEQKSCGQNEEGQVA